MNEYLNIEQAEKFYDYVKPTIFVALAPSFNVEIEIKDKQHFLELVKLYNAEKNVYATFRECRSPRCTESVVSLDKFVIDLDTLDEVAIKQFEEYLEKNKLRIEAKVLSGGGYHFYIPYKVIKISEQNRKEILRIIKNFKDELCETRKLLVDRKIFDLPRVIRIWGTFNYNKNKSCELLYFNKCSEEDITYNTVFINSLPSLTREGLCRDTNVLSCFLFNLLNEVILKKSNTKKNDILLKNMACFLREAYSDEGYEIGVRLTLKQGHSENEFKGWWNKRELKFNCGEMVKWLKEYYEELLPQTCNICRAFNKNNIVYVNSVETFHQLKPLMRENFRLYINKEVCMKVDIQPGIYSAKTEIPVLRRYEITDSESGTIDYLVWIIGEPDIKISKGMILAEELSVDFFTYSAIADGKDCLLFSDKELELAEYYIEGSLLKIKDQMLAGKYSKVGSKKQVIMRNSDFPLIRKIRTVDELFNDFNFSREQFLDFLFSHKRENKIYIEPEWLTDLLLAFLFSGSQPYPLHLIVCGQQGCGKTSMLEAIFDKFDNKSIHSGTVSTMKSLIPSFGASKPELGLLLGSRRLCYVDEFFRLAKNEEDENRFTVMNEILEYRARSFSSGKGSIPSTKMKSKLFGITNPIEGKTFRETVESLPETALSRVVIINLNEDFTRWVNDFVNYKPYTDLVIDKYKWQSVYDFLNEFVCRYEKSRVDKIILKLKQQVPDFMKKVFNTRFVNHHSYLLLDGIVKSRCLFSRTVEFCAIEEDYLRFEMLINKLIMNWKELQPKLNELQKAMIDLVPVDGIESDVLQELCKKRQIDFIFNLSVLKTFDRIRIEGTKIYKRVYEEDIDFSVC